MVTLLFVRVSVVLLGVFYIDTVFADDPKIIFAAVIYRHGARTPTEFYGDDPHEFLPVFEERGHLTNEGKRQQYLLGQWLRKRYSDLLGKEYNHSDIYVRSTDKVRTIMSAQANLAGMYQPEKDRIWDEQLSSWQPIQINVVPHEKDDLFFVRDNCSAYEKEWSLLYHSCKYRNLRKPFKTLFKYLERHIPNKSFNLGRVRFLYNTWSMELEHNLSIPVWAHEVYPEPMRSAASASLKISTLTRRLTKFRIGALIKEITDLMTRAKQGVEYNQNYCKVSMYSAHDNNIANLINGMKLKDAHLPPFTATLLIELSRAKCRHNSYIVRIFYRNSTGIVEPDELHVHGTGRHCTLDEFMHTYDYLIKTDLDEDCNAE